MIVFAPKAWDVLINPVVGRLSDQYAVAHLPRRPFLRGAASALDPATLDDAAFDGLLEIAGVSVGGELALPDRMAPVNTLLDVASPRLREALLVAFLDRPARPTDRSRR